MQLCEESRDIIVCEEGRWQSNPILSSIEEKGCRFCAEQDGKLLRIRESSDTPIHIYYRGKGSSTSHLRIVVEKGCCVRIIEHLQAQEHTSIRSHLCLDLHKGSRVVHTRFEPRLSLDLASSLKVTVGDEASFDSTCACLLMRSRRCVKASVGSSAELHIRSLCYSPLESEQELFSTVEHTAQDSLSSIVCKAVVEGSSRMRSRVLICREAARAESHQLSRFLTLSDQARTVNEPQLQVFADDVKASHGATAGQIDEDMLWYMRTRGLPAPLARKLCIEGFCEEVLEHFSETDKAQFLQALEMVR